MSSYISLMVITIVFNVFNYYALFKLTENSLKIFSFVEINWIHVAQPIVQSSLNRIGLRTTITITFTALKCFKICTSLFSLKRQNILSEGTGHRQVSVISNHTKVKVKTHSKPDFVGIGKGHETKVRCCSYDLST